MFRKLLPKVLLSCCILLYSIGYSQNNVGIGTAAPDPSALLELKDGGKGFLVPRMDSTQRNAIQTPANGLLIFDTDVNCFYYYTTANGWASLCATAAGSGSIGATGPTGATGTGTTGPTGPTGPLGAAGGDLSGTYPNPTVSGIQGNAVSATAPTANQLLIYNGAQWVPGDGNNIFWKITGNSGTVPATNFIGTTDNTRFVLRTNNVERATIDNAGNLGIGTAAPVRSLHISGTFNNATVGSGLLRQSNVSAGGGYGGGVSNPAFSIQQPGIRVDAFGNSAGFNSITTNPTNSYPRYLGVDANGDFTVMTPRTEYYHVIQNQAIDSVNLPLYAGYTIVPNLTQTITVPNGQTAEVYLVASIGFNNHMRIPNIANSYNLINFSFFINGSQMQYGGASYNTIANSATGTIIYANTTLNAVAVLTAGVNTIELRTRLQPGSGDSAVDIGGDGVSDSRAGEMTVIVHYR